MKELHSPTVDLHLLKVFHAIYHAKSVTTAAEKLGLTQSALSHSLKRLRELFQDDIFLRSGAVMVPTPRAQTLLGPVCRIIETFESEILSVAVFDSKLARREFSLAMTDMAEVVFLPPLMRHFRQHAPRCTLRTRRLSNDQMVKALEDGVAELAIGNIPEAHGSNFRQTLFTHDFVVLAWADHPRLGTRLTWDEYQREEHIVVTSGSDTSLQERTLSPLGIKRKVYLTVGGFLSVPWLIQKTELIATVPTRLSEGIAEAAMVKQLALPQPAEPYALQTLWHSRMHHDPGHRWLRETLFQLMNRYPNVK